MSVRTRVGWAALTVLVSGSAFAQEATVVPGAERGRSVEAPAAWVPLRAALVIDGEAAGRWWRGADGSTRVDRLAPDRRGVTIEIRHIATRRYYEYRPASGWTAHPMLLPTQGWEPDTLAPMTLGARVSDARSAHEVFEVRTRRGPERHIPALNFLKVSEYLPDGRSQVLTEIVSVAPPDDLWQPPRGAAVLESHIPRGIVALPAPRR